MADETFWQAISNAGIRLRSDFADPSQWISATRWHQYGPFQTREEALSAAIRGLIAQLEASERRIEKSEQRVWWEGISSFFSLF